jgi:ATP-dependent Clp protease ATP-binding subunit ClpC
MPVDPTRLDKFTHRAKEVVRMAERDAARLGTGGLSCEAILAALLGLDQSASSVVLQRLSVDVGTLRSEMSALAEAAPEAAEGPSQGEWPESAARAVHASYEEAGRLDVGYVGTEHLLLGALQCLGEQAARMVERHGVTPQAVRDEVKKLQSGIEPQGTPDQWNELLRAELKKVVEVLDSGEADALGKKSALEIVEELRRSEPQANETSGEGDAT